MKKNKTVFLTGASRGIGKAIYQLLKKQVYKIIAPSRHELNLSDVKSVNSFIKENKNLKIDILINNAGVNFPQWIEELDNKNLFDTVQINLLSPIVLIRTFVPHMKKQQWGRIVNISSMFGIVARGKQVPYSASKHGINGATKALALELGKHNILINSVCPGFVKTDLILKNSLEKLKALASDVPLGRLAEPEEIAELVLFLISSKNTYINGANIIIDGGFTCR